MLKSIKSGNFEIHYPSAKNAFVFDETNSSLATFHNAPMKAVDVLAECEDFDYFVEIKDFDDPAIYEDFLGQDEDIKKAPRIRLRNILKYKFRDTYLYRCAEDKVEKPIVYIVLSTLNYQTNFWLQRELRKEIPVGKPNPTLKRRWKRTLLEICYVVDLLRWNEYNFFGSHIKRV